MINRHQTKRPRRQKKADRILHQDATAAEIRCDHANAPFDRLARAMDRKWGVDRLPELVSPETAEKYGSALAKLNAAISSNDPEAVVLRAGVCMRGMAAMDREATAAGQQEATGDFWEYRLGSFHFGILKDAEQWPAAKEARPDLMMFTMREAALALKSYCETVPLAEIKKHFPAAQVSKLPDKLPSDFFKHGDDIPF